MTEPRSDLPLVTAIVPCRNEAAFIGACLTSLLGNDYAADRLEVLVVDGMSADGTRDLVARIAAENPRVRLIDNPSGTIPAAMNIGIRHARGSVIAKVDGHSTYNPDYLSSCVHHLVTSGADNVGGVLVTEPRNGTRTARAIALVLAHPFGSGNSAFRVGCESPLWTDTAAFGCYRREALERLGGYNEQLIRSSDLDLNSRLRAAGGRILLVPTITAHYFPVGGALEFFRRNVIDGFWAVYPLRFGGRTVRLRHVVPLASALAVFGAALAAPLTLVPAAVVAALGAAYTALSVVASSAIARRERDPLLALLLPPVFAARHGGYALGSTWGLVRAAWSPVFWQRAAGLEPGTQA